jgi:hypothetical protein
MKYSYETEEDFLKRVKEAKARGECIFRDDANREFILDLIDEYMDLIDATLIDKLKDIRS